MAGMFGKLQRMISERSRTDAVVLLLEHRSNTAQTSPVAIIPADHTTINDAGHFQNEKQLKLFHRFLDQGDKGYLGYLNGKCVHRSWVQEGPKKVQLHKFLTMQLGDNEVFIHYCETAPEARGENIFSHVLSHIAYEFRGKKIFISVDKNNASSQRSMEKAGFAVTARCHIVVIFGVKKRTWTRQQ